MSRDDDRTAREISRGRRKKAGDRSSELARELMTRLKDHHIKKLQLEPDLHTVVVEARKITSPVARRRAERALAGELRRWDLLDLQKKLARLHEGDQADVALFHQAEQWRARLIEEGIDAAKDLPGGTDDELFRLIAAARRERDTGKPPGAARALFRHVMAQLEAEKRNAELAADDDLHDELADDDEPDDETDDER